MVTTKDTRTIVTNRDNSRLVYGKRICDICDEVVEQLTDNIRKSTCDDIYEDDAEIFLQEDDTCVIVEYGARLDRYYAKEDWGDDCYQIDCHLSIYAMLVWHEDGVNNTLLDLKPEIDLAFSIF